MQGGLLFVPHRAVQIEPILGQSSQVYRAKIAASRWPIRVIGSGFAKVVDARPDKLADGKRMVVLRNHVVVGQVAPSAAFHIVRRALPIIVGGHFLFLNWELIHPATAHRGGGFRPENEALRLLGNKFVVEMYAIVEARNIKCSVKSTLGIGLRIVATAGYALWAPSLFHCSGISLPMLHITIEGWLRCPRIRFSRSLRHHWS